MEAESYRMTITPKTYHLFSVAVILVFLAVGFVTIADYGMGWDEVTRWKSGDLKIEYYQNLLQGEDLPSMSGDRYPGLFDMTLGIAHRIFGADRMLLGHGMSILFGALGLAATAWLANITLGARAGFLAVLFLVLYPKFYGHAMINPKDVPFMATYTLGLATVLWIARFLMTGSAIPWSKFLLSGLAIGMAGACRVPGLVLLAFATAAWMFSVNVRNRQWELNLKKTQQVGLGLVVAGLSALGVLLVFFPRLHSQLFLGVANVTQSLHSTAHQIPLLFRGQIMDANDAPRLYAHIFFGISTPIWMLVLLGIGLAVVLIRLLRHPDSLLSERTLKWLFISFAAFPWLYILITRPALHNGVRHMLWAVPPLIVLMTAGFDWIQEIVRKLSPNLRLLPGIVLGGFIFLQTVHLFLMHPYQYVFFNPLAGERQTIINRYEGEYWFTSTRQLLEALPAVAQEQGLKPSPESPVPVRVSGPLNSAYPFVPAGFVLIDSFNEADFFLSNTTFRTDLLVDGETVYKIERGGIPIGVIKRLKPVP